MIPWKFNLPKARLEIHGFQSNPTAPRIILALHGWLDNCFSFLPLAQDLTDYNLIAIDLPGHGDSDSIAPGMTYDISHFLLCLHELILSFGEAKIILLGHSMGAAIASLYAGIFSERLGALLLLEGLGPPTIEEVQGPAKMKAYIQQWMVRNDRANGLYSNWEEAVKARQVNGPLTRASALTLAERGAGPVDGGIRWKHDPRLKLPSRYPYSEAQTLAYLGQITCPTLFIQALDSIMPDHPIMHVREAQLRHMEKVKLAGGHHLHLDDAKPVALAIEAFCKKFA